MARDIEVVQLGGAVGCLEERIVVRSTRNQADVVHLKRTEATNINLRWIGVSCIAKVNDGGPHYPPRHVGVTGTSPGDSYAWASGAVGHRSKHAETDRVKHTAACVLWRALDRSTVCRFDGNEESIPGCRVVGRVIGFDAVGKGVPDETTTCTLGDISANWNTRHAHVGHGRSHGPSPGWRRPDSDRVRN